MEPAEALEGEDYGAPDAPDSNSEHETSKTDESGFQITTHRSSLDSETTRLGDMCDSETIRATRTATRSDESDDESVICLTAPTAVSATATTRDAALRLLTAAKTADTTAELEPAEALEGEDYGAPDAPDSNSEHETSKTDESGFQITTHRSSLDSETTRLGDMCDSETIRATRTATRSDESDDESDICFGAAAVTAPTVVSVTATTRDATLRFLTLAKTPNTTASLEPAEALEEEDDSASHAPDFDSEPEHPTSKTDESGFQITSHLSSTCNDGESCGVWMLFTIMILYKSDMLKHSELLRKMERYDQRGLRMWLTVMIDECRVGSVDDLLEAGPNQAQSRRAGEIWTWAEDPKKKNSVWQSCPVGEKHTNQIKFSDALCLINNRGKASWLTSNIVSMVLAILTYTHTHTKSQWLLRSLRTQSLPRRWFLTRQTMTKSSCDGLLSPIVGAT